MKAPFELVETEPGRFLHVHVQGPEGAPWVLIDHGAFGMFADCWWISEALKASHRVVLFGRAGMGWSSPVPEGVSATPHWHVDDMRRLMQVLDASPPFVLIGHSMAGLRLVQYLDLYPEDLAGLIFIDAMHPENLGTPAGRALMRAVSYALVVGEQMSRFGAAHLVVPLLKDQIGLPDQRRREKSWVLEQAGHWKAARLEFDAVRDHPDFTRIAPVVKKPVVVLSRESSGGECAALVRQAEAEGCYARLYAQAGETHTSLLNPRFANLIADEVRIMTC